QFLATVGEKIPFGILVLSHEKISSKIEIDICIDMFLLGKFGFFQEYSYYKGIRSNLNEDFVKVELDRIKQFISVWRCKDLTNSAIIDAYNNKTKNLEYCNIKFDLNIEKPLIVDWEMFNNGR
ncbi:MAG: hypothetical protein ACPGVN_03095, partial [Alphaproteobacteria bacterium]